MSAIEPPPNCSRCARLVAFREANRAAFPTFHNAPVPPFGSLDAPLLVVGLAPGLKGANRTGRPFTGDYAGDLLYPTLVAFGLARGHFDRRPDDGLVLVGCRVTNAVRCLPPANKPNGAEISTCRGFLQAEIDAMPALRVILALGRVAHERSEEHTSELQSLMRISYAVFCLKKKKQHQMTLHTNTNHRNHY